MCYCFWHFPSVIWHRWLGDRKGIRLVKSWVFVCWWWRFHWSFARLIAPVVTTTSIILSSFWLSIPSSPIFRSISSLLLPFNGYFSRWTSVSQFYWTKDNGGGGDNHSYKPCKTSVKLSQPTNQHPVFYRPDALHIAQPTVSKLRRQDKVPNG